MRDQQSIKDTCTTSQIMKEIPEKQIQIQIMYFSKCTKKTFQKKDPSLPRNEEREEATSR